MSFLAPETPTVDPVEILPPVAPTEETSLKIGEGETDKKKTGKSSLKLPLVDTTETGLRV